MMPRPAQDAAAPRESQPVATAVFVSLMVALAVALRLAWAWRYGLVLEQEGVEYTRLAENLLAGRGYRGMFDNGTQLNFPPLYPMAIALVSGAVGSTEWAARVVNIVAGGLLVVAVYRLAAELHGPVAARVAAVLAAAHPSLVAAGASGYVEGFYAALVAWALVFVIRWLGEGRSRWGAAAGAMLGLAYLARPEAFIMVLALVAVGVAGRLLLPELAGRWKGALALGAVFTLVALPNVVFLTRATGRVRIEAKGTLAYAWGSRMNAGADYFEAANGIGPHLEETGVFMRSNLDVLNETHYTLRDYLPFVLRAATHNVGEISDVVASRPSLGSPTLFLLVVLGVLTSPWTRHRLARDGAVLLTCAIMVAVLFTVQETWFRYFLALLALLLPWTGRGAEWVGRWTEATVANLGGTVRLAVALGRLACWGAVALLLLHAARGTPREGQFQESLRRERAEAGRWLRSQAAPGRFWVMGFTLQTPYYAGADLVYLPYADADRALRYIAKRRPSYIVLEGREIGGLPYTADWFERGIPDPRAELVYDHGEATAERIKIYRWADSSQ